MLSVQNVSQRKEFSKLRISSHQLQIEIGRYSKPRKTPIPERICKLCNDLKIEDEQHFIMDCPFYSIERNTLFTKLASFSSFNLLTNEEQFQFIMSYNNGDTEILKHVLNFVNISMSSRKQALIV